MIEIDIVKASNHLKNKPLPRPSSFYQNDDTDISEPDTALNTPTGSIITTDGFNNIRRYSSSSSSAYSYNFKRRPSFTPKSSPEFLPSSPPQQPQKQQPHQQQLVELLEKKIQALENDLSQHVKREIDLESQLLLLTEKQKESPTSQYKSTLTRIGKQIDQFLVTQQQQHNHKSSKSSSKMKCANSDFWSDSGWIGLEMPALHEGCMDNTDTTFSNNADVEENVEQSSNNVAQFSSSTSTSAIPILLIYRLKSMINDFAPSVDCGSGTTTKEFSIKAPTPISNFITELSRTLDSWQEFYNTTEDAEKGNKVYEQDRVTRLLQALQKSLLKNKVMKQDHDLIVKKYRADMKHLVIEVDTKIVEQQEQVMQQERQQQEKEQKAKQQQQKRESGTIFNQSRLSLLEKQLRASETKLHECQDERDEYETALEMMKREMQTTLEELEDTRQQRVRYKTQASRLRAALETIQKKQKRRKSTKKGENDSNENSSSSDNDEEDEGREAIRSLYNEAERQAIDLDRECKRQALTLNSVREELKQMEEKYHTIKSERNKELKKLQRANERLSREIEMLQLEKHELISLQQQQQQLSSSNSRRASMITTTNSNGSIATAATTRGLDEKAQHTDARIYALQIALKAAKSEAIIQRTKISQLEKQSALANLDHKFVTDLQDLFQKELKAVSSVSSTANKKELEEMAKIVEVEQKLWRCETQKTYQKKYDVDLLRVNREARFLFGKLVDAQDEAQVLKSRHVEEMALLKHQFTVDFHKRLQQQTSRYRSKEQELQDQLEILYQKNQTLQDESLILYGRNMLMAQKLGKIET